MAQVLLLAFVFNQDDVGTARISQIITSLTSGSLFVFAWSFLFRNRPPSSTLQDHQSLWNVGFSKVFQTGREIYLHMPALRCLMGSVLFAESAMNTIVTVGTTYMSTFLDMTSSEIGFVFLVVLIMGIPGAKLGQLIALRLSPLISAKLSILCLLISTTLAAALLTGPQHKHYVVIFAVFWGLSLGWLHPMHTIMFIGLTPDDSRTEFMGIYIFSQQILSWLPALVFTILNEAGASMSIGLASLDIFFVFGLVSLQLMGSYDEVKKTPREIQVAMVDTELPSLS
jgi:MFS-type transporter involved in bile tolerance (Atg22 family)